MLFSSLPQNQIDSFGLDPVWWFFLAFGEEVRKASSREDPVDHRGRSCQTLALFCPLPSCSEPTTRRSCRRKRYHPFRKNLFTRSSLPRVREAIRQDPLLVHEDAIRSALAGGGPRYYLSPGQEILL